MINILLINLIANYDQILMILLPFNIAVALGLGVYYIWKYKNVKSIVTFLWGIGFICVGLGILGNYLITYILTDLYNQLSSAGIDLTKLFQNGGILILTVCLAITTFYTKVLSKKSERIGKYIFIVIGGIGLTYLIITSFVSLDLFDVASMMTRLTAVWIILFFGYVSIKNRNIRLISISIGFIIATISGLLMVIFKGTVLGIIGNVLQFVFYFFIAYGLFYLREKVERERMEQKKTKAVSLATH